jgi:hypothetical protein
MQDAAISKETLFNVHHTTGTQFVDSGIWMCCTPDTHMATPQILCLTWNMCAAMCRTQCLVRGMLTGHLGLPQHRNWRQTVRHSLPEAATSSTAPLTAYKRQAFSSKSVGKLHNVTDKDKFSFLVSTG